MAKKKLDTGGPELSRWLSRVLYANRVRHEADQVFGYTRAHLQYQTLFDRAMPSFIKDASLVPISEVYAFCKAFIPSVYSRDPHIEVTSHGREFLGGSKLLELAVNAYWRELNLKREVKRCLLDAILAVGYMKVGFTASFGSIDGKDGAPNVDPSEYVKNQELFAKRISWKRMSFDPEATNGLYDARWVVEEIIAPLEAIQKAPFLDKTKNLAPAFVNKYAEQEPMVAGYIDAAGGEEQFGRYFMVWDRDNEEVLFISPESPDILGKMSWPKGVDGFPYVMLRFNENPDEPYGPNLISPWEPQLWEKIKVRSMQMDHIKRFNRQFIAEEGTFTKLEEAKLLEGRTGAIIKKKANKPDPTPLNYPQLQTDIYAIENRIDLDKDNISGQPNAVRSAPQRTQSRTLGEIDRLISSFQARQTEPQSVVEDFSSEVASKLIASMKSNLPGKKWVKATQKDFEVLQAAFPDRFDPEDGGVRFSKEDIAKAEMEVSVKSGSTIPLDREGKIESLIQFLKLGATIGIQPGSKLALKIGESVLGEFEMPDIEAAYEQMLLEMDNAAKLQNTAMKASLSATRDKIISERQALQQQVAAGGGGDGL